jgi:hypothetical protein
METYVCTDEVQGCVVRDHVPFGGLCATREVGIANCSLDRCAKDVRKREEERRTMGASV